MIYFVLFKSGFKQATCWFGYFTKVFSKSPLIWYSAFISLPFPIVWLKCQFSYRFPIDYFTVANTILPYHIPVAFTVPKNNNLVASKKIATVTLPLSFLAFLHHQSCQYSCLSSHFPLSSPILNSLQPMADKSKLSRSLISFGITLRYVLLCISESLSGT